MFGNLTEHLRNLANQMAVERIERQVGEVRDTIARHSLLGSFQQHVRTQLQRGRVRVGIIDVFGNGSHGERVAVRLLASAPSNIRNKIELHTYDVNEMGQAEALAAGASAARNKYIVALSVSGGLEAYNANQLVREIGALQLDQGTRGRALATLLRTYDRGYANAMRALSEASYSVPVVTPIWNDGNITAAALGANTIVTSIHGTGTQATPVPHLVDIYMNPMPRNGHTSQSPPLFIGQALEL